MSRRAKAVLSSLICSVLIGPLAFAKKSEKTESLPAREPREIAITIDDAPRGVTSMLLEGEREKKLLANLKKADAPAIIFFANSAQFDKLGPSAKKRLRTYAKAGNFIGNHTHSHPDLTETSIEDFKADIKMAQKKMSRMDHFVRFFRFPYLREGETEEKMTAIRQQLKSLKLKNAYVTVNTYDWAIDAKVQKAMDDLLPIDMEALKRVYLDIIMNDVNHYDKMAVEVLDRSPKHVLLLHENDLTALFVGALIERLREEGWKVIPAPDAYKDEIASYVTKTAAKRNPGRIGEIARDKGFAKSKLWSSTCDEDEIGKRLKTAKVF